jgi:hypothetical protein
MRMFSRKEALCTSTVSWHEHVQEHNRLRGFIGKGSSPHVDDAGSTRTQFIHPPLFRSIRWGADIAKNAM